MTEQIETLRAIKAAQGLSFERMAARLGVSWRTLYRWLNENTTPSLMAQEKIRAFIEAEKEND